MGVHMFDLASIVVVAATGGVAIVVTLVAELAKHWPR